MRHGTAHGDDMHGFWFTPRAGGPRDRAREAKIRRAEIEDQIRLDVRDAALDYEFWKGQCSSLDEPINGDVEKNLQRKLRNIETLKESGKALAVLEWAVGTAIK